MSQPGDSCKTKTSLRNQAEGSITMFGASVYELSCVTGPRELGKTKLVPLKNIQSNRGDRNSHMEPQSIVGTDRM